MGHDRRDAGLGGAKAGAALLAVGMTLYWPFFIHPLVTSSLLPAAGASWTPWYYALVLAAMATCLLVAVVRGRATLARKIVLPASSLCVVAALVGLLWPGFLTTNRGLAQVLAIAAPLVLGVQVALITLGWAGIAEGLSPARRAVALGISLVGAQLVNAGALSAGAALGMPDPAWSFVFPLLSGVVLLVARARGYDVGGDACEHGSTDGRLAGSGCFARDEGARARGRAADTGASGCVDAADVATGYAGSRAGRMEPGGAMRPGARSWLLMLGVLVLYLLASGVFRSSYTAQTGEAEPVFDMLQRLVVLLASLAVLAYASRSLARPGREPYPWVVFAFACLAILYLLLIGGQWFPEACNVIVLHSRLIAVFLMWAAAERFSRGRVRGPLVLTALFLPAQTAVRLITSAMGEGVWQAAWAGVFLEAILLVTAFAMTLGVFFWVRLRATEASGLGAAVVTNGAIDDGAASLGTVAGGALTSEEARERFGLTDRETDVLRLLARGYTQKSIAGELDVSFNSVRTYAKALYLKLGVHSRQEVIDLMSGRPTA